MKRSRIPMILAAAFASSGLTGCGIFIRDNITRDVERHVQEVDLRAVESRTLTHLSTMEQAVSDFYRAEKRVPVKLEELIPKYLPEIPQVELGVKGHSVNNDVRLYPAEVIQDGAIDGVRIRDTGRWGYAAKGNRVIIFVDCVHRTSKGNPWYQERGVY